MKKTLILLTAVIALCAISSCKKEPVNEHPLEGVWGLTHMETSVTYTEPALQPHSENYDCDPFHPTSERDCKLVCKWISGNDYETTTYLWDTSNNDWRPQVKFISTVDGNKLLQTIEGRTEAVGTITFQNDMMTVSGTSQIMKLGSDEVYSTTTFNETFKKME